MARDSIDLLELLRKRGVDGDVDFLREALRVLTDALMDAEVTARIGAERGERSPDRLTYRNGYRSRQWDTRVGTMELRIPKLREGSYFPSLLEPRRRMWRECRRGGRTSGASPAADRCDAGRWLPDNPLPTQLWLDIRRRTDSLGSHRTSLHWSARKWTRKLNQRFRLLMSWRR